MLTQDHGSRPLRVPSPSPGRVSGQGMQGRSEGSRGKVKGGRMGGSCRDSQPPMTKEAGVMEGMQKYAPGDGRGR